MMTPYFKARAIGFIKSPFQYKADAPHQPQQSQGMLARITLNPTVQPALSLKNIVQFEWLWIIAWFHHNRTWKPLVLPPGQDKKRGVFASRSPYRPNPIGLSLVRLVEVKKNQLIIEGCDLLDGTPVLDIKPYLDELESRSSPNVNWIRSQHASRSDWVVNWSEMALKQVNWLTDYLQKPLVFIIEKIVTDSPYPHQNQRIRQLAPTQFVLAYRYWRFYYEISGNQISIQWIRPAETVTQTGVFQEFWNKWPEILTFANQSKINQDVQ